MLVTLVIATFITFGILVYLNNTAEENRDNTLCGDGFCSDGETCAVDCSFETWKNPFGNPFSVWGASVISNTDYIPLEFKEMNNLGIRSFKSQTLLPLDYYLKFGWDTADAAVSEARKYGLKVILTITPKGKVLPTTREDIAEYKQYVRDFVSRYKNDVDSWEVVNELSAHWSDRSSEKWENYARLLMMTVKEIKAVQPEAKIVMPGPATDLFEGGNADEDSVEIILKTLEPGTRWFDYFDPHFIGSLDPVLGKNDRYLDIIYWTEYYKKVLDKYGYSNVGWFMEIASAGGGIIRNTEYPEKDQAIDLIKKYIVAASLGYLQIHNNGAILPKDPKLGHNLDYKEFIPLMIGDNQKKLAYYSTKKLIEVLGNMSKVEKIEQKDQDIYLFKFTVDDRDVFIAWHDDGEGVVTLSGINDGIVKITSSVPENAKGGEIINYETAFKNEIKTLNNGQISITINELPVYIQTEYD